MTPIEFYRKEFDKYKKSGFIPLMDLYKQPDYAPFICPRLYCNDGFSMSVQASRFHYCMPKIAGATSYLSMEVGYPSKPEPLLDEYRELLDNSHWKSVYPFVPYEIIEQIVEKHGGINER